MTLKNLAAILDPDASDDRSLIIQVSPEGDEQLRLSYGEGRRRIAALARGLLKHGLKRGEAVAIVAANSADYLMLYMATMAAGLVSVCVNHKLPRETVAHIMTDAGVKFAVADDERAPLVRELVPTLAMAELDSLLDPGPFTPIEMQPEETAMVLYTSGSTGTPKGVAVTHDCEATIMAKPFASRAGSGLHLHVSVNDGEGFNIFATKDPAGTPALRHAIGGLKATLADGMAIFAPNANSYRRFRANSYAPVAPTWGVNNRTVSLRVPAGPASGRHVEHRVAGADANPYIAIASSLACGYLGMVQNLRPSEPISGSAHDLPWDLPRSLDDALKRLMECQPLVQLLGQPFVSAYTIVKQAEHEVFLQVISSWEREHLLLNV